MNSKIKNFWEMSKNIYRNVSVRSYAENTILQMTFQPQWSNLKRTNLKIKKFRKRSKNIHTHIFITNSKIKKFSEIPKNIYRKTMSSKIKNSREMSKGYLYRCELTQLSREFDLLNDFSNSVECLKKIEFKN